MNKRAAAAWRCLALAILAASAHVDAQTAAPSRREVAALIYEKRY